MKNREGGPSMEEASQWGARKKTIKNTNIIKKIM
jgi:hypothetical protein